MQASLGVTGLTGPGEPWFNISSRAVPKIEGGEGEGGDEREKGYEDESDEEEMSRYFPSVFSELREAEEKELRRGERELAGEEEEEEEKEDSVHSEHSDDDSTSYKERKNKFGWDVTTYPDPAQLDLNASAAQVVQAWAFRLKGEIPHKLSNVRIPKYLFLLLTPMLAPTPTHHPR
jgi:hypothetical protein